MSEFVMDDLSILHNGWLFAAIDAARNGKDSATVLAMLDNAKDTALAIAMSTVFESDDAVGV